MKASIAEGLGKPFAVREVDIAAPLRREVLSDVKASGLCLSDLSVATLDLGHEFPIVFGHEVVGVVSAVGSGVTSIRVGAHVVGSLLPFCGRCVNCLSGRTHRRLPRTFRCWPGAVACTPSDLP
ncbi:alcohol dehydrogenase catalytic domain-containing protein [Streptomyces sp. CA-106110]